MSPPTSPPPKPVNIDPVLALQLRVRWLETLISGLRPSLGQSDPKSNDPGTATLLRKAEDLHAKLHDALDHNETCKKFLKNYDQYASLLVGPPLSANGAASAPALEGLDQEELESLLLELEPDIRAADRDLREIDEFNSRGISAAGKLPEHEGLKARLQALVEAQQQDLVLYGAIEAKIANILHAYALHVASLSELFVSWNDLMIEAEDRVQELERRHKQKSLVEFQS